MQMIILRFCLLFVLMTCVGCDLIVGGSKVTRLSLVDRCRLESIRALANDLKSSSGEIRAPYQTSVHIARAKLAGFPKFSFAYIYITSDKESWVYEKRQILDLSSNGDLYKDTLLACNFDGEIRFLSVSDWSSKIESLPESVKSITVECQTKD